MQWVNIKAAKELIKRYNSITLDEIETEYKKQGSMHLVPKNLTGFGSDSTCTLCKEAESILLSDNIPLDDDLKDSFFRCHTCIYNRVRNIELGYPDHLFTCQPVACIADENAASYYLIDKAKSAKELLFAFRNRAKHLRKLVDKIEKSM